MKTTLNPSIDRRIPLALIALAASTLTGCGFDRTIVERTTLGADQAVWTLTPALLASTNDTPATATNSLTRAHWQPVDFIVPVDGTIHGPLWRWDAAPPRNTPRNKALYPTAETALELASPQGPQVREAVLAPLVAFANSFALPVLVFTNPPADSMSPSAATLYKRSPKGRPIAGPIPEPAPAAKKPPPSDP